MSHSRERHMPDPHVQGLLSTNGALVSRQAVLTEAPEPNRCTMTNSYEQYPNSETLKPSKDLEDLKNHQKPPCPAAGTGLSLAFAPPATGPDKYKRARGAISHGWNWENQDPRIHWGTTTVWHLWRTWSSICSWIPLYRSYTSNIPQLHIQGRNSSWQAKTTFNLNGLTA